MNGHLIKLMDFFRKLAHNLKKKIPQKFIPENIALAKNQFLKIIFCGVNFINKRLQNRYFPVNITKFLRKPF